MCFARVTGCSSATVIFNFSPTGTLKERNGKTQPFLSSSHLDILMFFCLSIEFDDKNDLLGLFPNSVIAPHYID